MTDVRRARAARIIFSRLVFEHGSSANSLDRNTISSPFVFDTITDYFNIDCIFDYLSA